MHVIVDRSFGCSGFAMELQEALVLGCTALTPLVPLTRSLLLTDAHTHAHCKMSDLLFVDYTCRFDFAAHQIYLSKAEV